MIDYLVACIIFITCIVVIVILVLAYVNRLIETRLSPIAKRLGELESERQEIETRYAALQNLYQNLQSDFDELLKKYNLLQTWADGVIEILCALGQDYPPPPGELNCNKQYGNLKGSLTTK